MYTFLGEVAGAKSKFGSDGSHTLAVTCDNRAKELTERQEHKQWEDKKRSEIVTEIAEKYGLKPYVVESGDVVPFETQAGITDASMCARLAAKENNIFKVRGNALYWGPEGETRTPSRLYHFRIEDHTIESADLAFKTEDEARSASGSQMDVNGNVLNSQGAGGDSQGEVTTQELAEFEQGPLSSSDDGVSFGEFETREENQMNYMGPG
jgi:phage protein D